MNQTKKQFKIFALLIVVALLSGCFHEQEQGSERVEIIPPGEVKEKVISPVKIEEKEEIKKRETPVVIEEQPQEENIFTIKDVARHNSPNDCWLLIDGRVYDVTKFIPTHPGGQAILQGCGKDATQLFETRPMGSGTPHSQTARTLRENYYIGDLK